LMMQKTTGFILSKPSSTCASGPGGTPRFRPC
jgi:hypothetical protein